jgi:hypothetical protein
MAKFDISPGSCATNIVKPVGLPKANNEPAPLQPCLRSDSIRMRKRDLPLGTPHPGLISPVRTLRRSLCFLAVINGVASGDEFTPTKVDPDPPARRGVPSAGPLKATPSWDLDGVYFWLGPTGAASHIDAEWDSTIGADATVIRVRERDAISVIGGTLGASRWTVRGGGRIWLDALIGTRMWKMVGASAGPILELNELSHPKLGGSFGLWAFVGVTPFVRAGVVQDLGGFVEVGLHIALPVIRR